MMAQLIRSSGCCWCACCVPLFAAADLHSVQRSSQGGELHWCKGGLAAGSAAEARQLMEAGGS